MYQNSYALSDFYLLWRHRAFVSAPLLQIQHRHQPISSVVVIDKIYQLNSMLAESQFEHTTTLLYYSLLSLPCACGIDDSYPAHAQSAAGNSQSAVAAKIF